MSSYCTKLSGLVSPLHKKFLAHISNTLRSNYLTILLHCISLSSVNLHSFSYKDPLPTHTPSSVTWRCHISSLRYKNQKIKEICIIQIDKIGELDFYILWPLLVIWGAPIRHWIGWKFSCNNMCLRKKG